MPKSRPVHGPRIDHVLAQAPPEAWQHLSAGAGAKGEGFYDWAAARLPAVWEFDGDEPTWQRRMLGRRSMSKPDEIAYYLACAPLAATVVEARGPPLRGMVPAHHAHHARPRVPHGEGRPEVRK